MKSFAYFYEQGLACEKMVNEGLEIGEQVSEAAISHLGYCHGTYNHHSVMLCEKEAGHYMATINFDKFYVGNQLRDLYHFLRKTVEKNGYAFDVLEIILSTYGKICPLAKQDLDYIYAQYCYPEKFYKLSNQYMNRAKNWISPKSIEKLKQIVEDEPKKQELLGTLYKNKNIFITI